MKGKANESDFTVHATNGRVENPTQVIFPVFLVRDDGLLRLLGTGFFISRLGMFVSAKHVFESVLDRDGKVRDGLVILHFMPGGKIYNWRPVTCFVVHGLADVGVGVCAPMKHKETGEPLFNKVLTLSGRLPRVGNVVYTYAYPGTDVTFTTPQVVSLSPAYFAGRVTAWFPTGRDRVLLPFPCHQTSIMLHRASSGGPVFGSQGMVVGVNSTGFDGSDDVSFISRIVDILELGLPDVQMPGESSPRRVSVRELSAINHVSFVR